MQSFDFHADPLCMFLEGAAGTRKSRVISAIQDYFGQCHQHQ